MGRRKTEVVVATRLPILEVEVLDRIAAHRGDSSRSSVLRDLVRRGLEQIDGEQKGAA